jgi:hypothetical protein
MHSSAAAPLPRQGAQQLLLLPAAMKLLLRLGLSCRAAAASPAVAVLCVERVQCPALVGRCSPAGTEAQQLDTSTYIGAMLEQLQIAA